MRFLKLLLVTVVVTGYCCASDNIRSQLFCKPFCLVLIPHPYYCPGQGFFTSHSSQNLRAIKHRVKSSIKAKIQITTQPGNICIIYVLQVQEMENSFQTHNPTWVFNQSPVIRIKSTIDRLEAWLVVETARGRISASSYGFNQAICLLPCRAVGQTSFPPDFF